MVIDSSSLGDSHSPKRLGLLLESSGLEGRIHARGYDRVDVSGVG